MSYIDPRIVSIQNQESPNIEIENETQQQSSDYLGINQTSANRGRITLQDIQLVENEEEKWMKDLGQKIDRFQRIQKGEWEEIENAHQ